ncbi:hypothetical protein [Nocardioides montaniterrae]
MGLFHHKTRVRIYRSHQLQSVPGVLAHPIVIHDLEDETPVSAQVVDEAGATLTVVPDYAAAHVGPDLEPAGTGYVPAMVTLPDAGTIPAVRRSTPYLTLDDGLSVLLDRTFVIGTNPVPPPSHPYAEPLAVTDPADSTSATHLLVSPARDGAWVIDLHSQTGVAIADDQGRSIHLPPGQPGRAVAGTEIHWGSRAMVVRL